MVVDTTAETDLSIRHSQHEQIRIKKIIRSLDGVEPLALQNPLKSINSAKSIEPQ